MSRQEVSVEVQVEAPPEAVWGLLTDLGRVHEWMRHIVSARSPKGLAKGSPLHVKAKLGPYVLESEAVVTEFDRPRLFEWRVQQNLLDGKPTDLVAEAFTRFELVHEKGWTQLRGHVGFVPVALKAKLAAGYAVKHYLRPQMEQAMANLKTLAEKEAKTHARKAGRHT